MKTLFCPKVDKCPIFNNNLLKNKNTEEAYKNIYCKNGMDKYTSCKRFQITEQLGRCADFVMPNSFLTLNEIIEKMREKELV